MALTIFVVAIAMTVTIAIAGVISAIVITWIGFTTSETQSNYQRRNDTQNHNQYCFTHSTPNLI